MLWHCLSLSSSRLSLNVKSVRREDMPPFSGVVHSVVGEHLVLEDGATWSAVSLTSHIPCVWENTKHAYTSRIYQI